MRRRALLAASVAVLALATCGPAAAAIVTVGPSLTVGGWSSKPCETSACAFLNYGNSLDPEVPTPWPSSPSNGVIVRLNVIGATTPGTVRVRTVGNSIARVGPLVTTFETASAPLTIVPTAAVQTYPMSMPITEQDRVGLSMPAGTSIGFREGGEHFGSWASDPPETGQSPQTKENSGLVGYNVEVQPAPTANLVVPFGGPTTGGTAVGIMGTDFIGVSSVTFGGVPAASFTVESEGRIKAISPPWAAPGPTTIAVTTIAGTATSPIFTYEDPPPAPRCVVPRLRGRTVKSARRALSKAACGLGTVKKLDGAKAKSGRVTRQSVKPGKKLAVDTEISVTLKPPRR